MNPEGSLENGAGDGVPETVRAGGWAREAQADTPVKIGVSECLLGEKVRYDGGHKLDRFIRDTLGQFVEYVPVCPEVECGLSAPREPMRLAGNPESPRLVTIHSGIDHTDRMRRWGEGRLRELADRNLCGYIFKSRSPSCGIERIKVYDAAGRVIAAAGAGIWARMVMDRFPLLPAEDEGRLHDPALRERFIERVFVYHRWRDTVERDPTPRALIEFHTRHKLLIMSHSIEHYRELGRMTAGAGEGGMERLISNYLKMLHAALERKTTVKKNVNVLNHVMGYFKKQISSDEKKELMEIIGTYHEGHIPLIAPITLINHYVRKYDQPYLRMQLYLNPHPVELRLRTHV